MENRGGTRVGAGRPQGTPNKLTKELRTILKDVLFNEIDQLPNHLQALQIKDRIELVVKLLPYALPRIEAASYKIGEPNDWFGD
jgi:hypothetical protein